MGKGARNRKKRRDAEERHEDAMRLIGELIEIDNWDAFDALITSEPDALGPEVLELLQVLGENEGYGASFRLIVRLIEKARSDPKAAWNDFAQRRAAMTARAERGEEIDAQITRAFEERRPDEAIKLIRQALPEAKELGLGIAVSQMYKQLGVALMQTASGDRAKNIEEAISAYQQALPYACGTLTRRSGPNDSDSDPRDLRGGLAWGVRDDD